MTQRAPIRLLDDQVINKIAAGEVVERPASVVKELIENALDAGATRIEVEAVEGGCKLIRVADNGCGMSHDDALLAIERHATSKIRDVRDIERISSMGFRGEALAAIPSVSRFTLRTRVADEAAGTELLVQGGVIGDVRDAGGPVGTEIEVRNLFFNVPARRKFLRSPPTETAHIRQLIFTYGLAFPAVGWSLTVDGRPDLALREGSDMRERLHQLFDRNLVDALRPVDYQSGDVTITGFAGLPAVHRPDRSGQFIFVNRRPASAPLVGYAIQQAYENLLPKGRSPVVVLFLDMPPDLVDVNVHPTKKEVRFRHTQETRDAIADALRQALGRAAPERDEPALPGNKSLDTMPDIRPFKARPRVVDLPGPVGLPPREPSAAPESPAPAGDPWDTAPAGSESPWGSYEIMGIAGSRYIVLSTSEGIVLMDPQAAHERIIFERLMKNLEHQNPQSQRLLAPETVTLPPAEAQLLRKNLSALAEIGFGVSEFGGDTLLVDALPACFKNASPLAILSEVAADLARGPTRHTGKKWTAEMIARAACRSAVNAARTLSIPEARNLIRDLSRAEMPYTCPHGRPTVIFMSYSELDKKFGRT